VTHSTAEITKAIAAAVECGELEDAEAMELERVVGRLDPDSDEMHALVDDPEEFSIEFKQERENTLDNERDNAIDWDRDFAKEDAA